MTSHPGAANEDDPIHELFSCGICEDILLNPITLACCGRSFCRGCVQQWIRTSVQVSGIPRCPGGCQRKLPYRLPSRSVTLQNAMEHLIPDELERRRREEAEDLAEQDEQHCHGGFSAWQEVAASRDIIFGDRIGVRQGTPGIIIGNFADHLTVKFDEREDGYDLCVNLLPEGLMSPLPGGFRLGQRIVTRNDLLLNGEIGVRLGMTGTVIGHEGGERLCVQFDQRLDNQIGTVIVHFKELAANSLLVGGFRIAQNVMAAVDLTVGSRVAVKAGTLGKVLAEFSDTRLTVSFDLPQGNGQSCYNVLPMEITPWQAPPSHLPVGQHVKATQDLLHLNHLIRKGTPGIVQGGVDDTQVMVCFDTSCESASGYRYSTVMINSVEPVEY